MNKGEEIENFLLNNTDIIDDGIPPAPLLSDYVEMMYLGSIFIIGIPLNFIVLKKLRQQNDNIHHSSKKGFILMKIHLNISDFAILLCNAFGKFCWILTYQWKGGDSLCRIFNFLNMFTLYLNSNIVVSIALDRLRNVVAAKRIKVQKKEIIIIKWYMIISWTFAIFFSLPQLYVWEVKNIFSNIENGWYQCTDIWTLSKYFPLEYKHFDNNFTKFILDESVETFYNISHLILVFWLPILIMIFCYIIIAIKIIHFSIKSPLRQEGKKQRYEMSNCEGEIYDSTYLSESSVARNVHKFLITKTQKYSETSGGYVKDEKEEIERNRESLIRRIYNNIDNREKNLSGNKKSFTFSLPAFNNKSSHCNNAYAKRKLGASKSLLVNGTDKSLSNTNIKTHNNSTVSTSGVPSFGDYQVTRVQKKSQTWHRQIRGKMFRTAFLVVLAHIFFWFPYNTISLMKYVNSDLHEKLNEHANVFKDMQYLLTIINPFLYGFN
ncbi:Gonadotropin-releasing hormone receptor [Strongyloides ratti]|uniref:Gonadotropin-releasing hormone receptor n=1 Tax=Strongyloides ratti TaxID=34506 RepID=A0A090KYE1_STRRB|nr:Gonadotropin-releasing hormone receptor [Strongyloides ratti]CEF62461.1 Gonadotropin-releasing hormone receptor [Strongyloides ratti]